MLMKLTAKRIRGTGGEKKFNLNHMQIGHLGVVWYAEGKVHIEVREKDYQTYRPYFKQAFPTLEKEYHFV